MYQIHTYRISVCTHHQTESNTFLEDPYLRLFYQMHQNFGNSNDKMILLNQEPAKGSYSINYIRFYLKVGCSWQLLRGEAYCVCVAVWLPCKFQGCFTAVQRDNLQFTRKSLRGVTKFQQEFHFLNLNSHSLIYYVQTLWK